ncbi:hypothetical protein QJQ58_06755 [Paenibacillus dendritiformis]|uniref:hypothetical protein n=1 Tax=Paenibacillus dendritiformis TaxID=130049 RepID=UPI00248B990C|nr:hypothetical protein [Paenibacillus dendritiformis]WGU95955.1 hypothetical protein QJQ58_06755 [Paenibacillus dendritiformis]
MRTFKTFDVHKHVDKVTRNYLQLCYMCDDKHRCTTENECKQCWEENGAVPEQQDDTRDLLQAYYA